MTATAPPDIAAKLRMIARLTPGELDAYRETAAARGWYPGELAAWTARLAQVARVGSDR